MSASLSEPLWELVEDSLDEAAFLWKRWEGELSSLTRNLDEVWSWTEDRLQGALDGVRAAGEQLTPRLCGDYGLASDDPHRWTVAGHLLAAASPPDARKLLAESIRGIEESRLWHVVRGIETADLDGSFAPVAAVLSTQGPMHSAALCRLKAFRRAGPGRELDEAYESAVPSFQVEALRAARFSAQESHRKLLASALKNEHAVVRRTAIELGVTAGLPEAWTAAVGLAQQLRADSAPMLSLLAMLGEASQHEVVLSALRKPELQRQAIFALGFIGTPEAAETCLAGMKDPQLARLAGEAYCAITGADLERDNLAAPEPEEPAQPIPFDTDDLDADLVAKPSDLWPLPDFEAVRRHWSDFQSRHPTGTRLVLGRPASLASLVQAVEEGPMLRRADLARELAARTNGRYDIEPRAFAHVQRRMMAASRTALSDATR